MAKAEAELEARRGENERLAAKLEATIGRVDIWQKDMERLEEKAFSAKHAALSASEEANRRLSERLEAELLSLSKSSLSTC